MTTCCIQEHAPARCEAKGFLVVVVDQAGATNDRLTPPPDMRHWVDTGTLIVWLDEEMEHMDRALPELRPCPRESTQDSFKATLCLLVFAYATEVFDSEEIARNCRANTAFRLLCSGAAPFPDELVQFRRKNRDLIATLLVNISARAVHHRFGYCRVAPTVPLFQHLRAHAIQRLDIARHMDTCDE
jgi:hypothetical protein